jgi:hypothetical protein
MYGGSGEDLLFPSVAGPPWQVTYAVKGRTHSVDLPETATLHDFKAAVAQKRA